MNAVQIQPDGRILVAGHFEYFGSRMNRRIVRLQEDGSVDATFKSPNLNNEIRHLLLLLDGRMLVSGLFTSIGTNKLRFLALLKADGAVDHSVDFGTGTNNVLGSDMILAFGDQCPLRLHFPHASTFLPEVPVAKQGREVPLQWAWTEASVWTERMLATLVRGIKGGKWFSLIDKVWQTENLQSAPEKVLRILACKSSVANTNACLTA